MGSDCHEGGCPWWVASSSATLLVATRRTLEGGLHGTVRGAGSVPQAAQLVLGGRSVRGGRRGGGGAAAAWVGAVGAGARRGRGGGDRVDDRRAVHSRSAGAG